MRIAAVTIAFNDHQHIALFRRHVAEYSSLLMLHIIVDNGSDSLYRKELRRLFPGSVILQRTTNGGTTAAYNDGIRYALQHDAEAILLVAQDVRLPVESLDVLIKVLDLHPEVGIAGPLLLRADGKTIEEYGGTIDSKTLEVKKLYAGDPFDNPLSDELSVDFIAGGMNLTRREVFEQVGLQDERLFMYDDETDFDLRVQKEGWKMLVVRKAIAVHDHQGDNSIAKPRPLFLMTRNRLWLVRKHLGRQALLAVSFAKILGLARCSARYLKHRRLDLAWAYVRGIAHGILGR